MTKEEFRQVFPILKEWIEGRTIQFYSSSDKEWYDIDIKHDLVFSCPPTSYRIKPEPQKIPLTQADIPSVCWLRRIGDSTAYLVYEIRKSVINASCVSSSICYTDLMDKYEYSSDLKTWHPCYKTV